jgi:hypothetical protein
MRTMHPKDEDELDKDEEELYRKRRVYIKDEDEER